MVSPRFRHQRPRLSPTAKSPKKIYFLASPACAALSVASIKPATALAGAPSGAAMACYDTALQYAKTRKQFANKPIAFRTSSFRKSSPG